MKSSARHVAKGPEAVTLREHIGDGRVHSTTFQVFLQGTGYKLIVAQQKYN